MEQIGTIRSLADIARAVSAHHDDRCKVVVLVTDSYGSVVGQEVVSIGTAREFMISAKDCIRSVLELGGSEAFVVLIEPSLRPNPVPPPRVMVRLKSLSQVFALMDIQLVDVAALSRSGGWSMLRFTRA